MKSNIVFFIVVCFMVAGGIFAVFATKQIAAKLGVVTFMSTYAVAVVLGAAVGLCVFFFGFLLLQKLGWVK